MQTEAEPARAEPLAETRDEAGRRSPWRFAAVVLFAVVLMPLNSYWVIQSELVRYQGHPTTISLFYNVVFILLVLTLLNLPLRRWAPRLALTPGELMTIYIVLCIGSAGAAHDAIQVLTPVMTHVYYYASPENGWADLIQPHMPTWLCMTDRQSLINMHWGESNFLEPENYRPWLLPGLWWTAFTVAMWSACLGLTSIFRRRWIHSERLTYPIVMLPLEMVAYRSRALPEGFYKNKMMWLAFGLALGADILNGIHTLKPLWPTIPISPKAIPKLNIISQVLDRPWNAIGFAPVSFYPFVIGLGLLLPTELATSCWVFFWFWKLQLVVGSLFGQNVAQGFPWIEEQEFGAYLAVTAFFVWVSRNYLVDVCRQIIHPRREVDSGSLPEGMSYRTAALLAAGGFAFVVWFSVAAGMPVWMAVVFFIAYFAISMAIGRIRAEMGMPAHDFHFAGPDQMLPNILGTRRFPPKALAINSMYWWFNRASRAHVLPHQAEAFKIAQRTGASNRSIVGALMVAIIVAMPVAFWAMLQCDYKYGVAAQMSGGAAGFGNEPMAKLASWLNAPTGFNIQRLLAAVVGAVFLFTTMLLKTRVAWWPVHPVGYAVSASWSMQYLWCPLMIASAIKWAVTRYGGHRAVQSLVPLAFGMILGDLTGGSFWTLYSLWKKVTVYSIWQ